MDYFAQLIENKATFPKTISIRKVYVNEDPQSEETIPCPKCSARNQQSTVRYMYVNLQEAIYKCESPSCMYPFQNFKFKNYSDNTVYYYTSAAEETPPALEDFPLTFTNVATPHKGTQEKQSANDNSTMDFNLHFLSPEHSHSNSKQTAVSPGLNIFDSPSLSYKNLIQDFDTGFIDDILQDLNQPSPENKPLRSPATIVPNKPMTGNRQLKRCLQMFKDASISSETVFKVPPLPGSEVTNSPKPKSKKMSKLRRHRHARKTHHSGSDSPDKTSKNRRMKPLDTIETIHTTKSNELTASDLKMAGVRTSQNQRVERMLNFIERSMKKREPTPEATVVHEERAEKHSRTYKVRKHHMKTKHLSLSAAVLQDAQFDYSTSESEQEDSSDAAPSSSKSVICDLAPVRPLPVENDSKTSLPSFEDLLQHINPLQPKVQASPDNSSCGFRSAGSSPTREQWRSTPPRRIHSMESLSSLLE